MASFIDYEPEEEATVSLGLLFALNLLFSFEDSARGGAVSPPNGRDPRYCRPVSPPPAAEHDVTCQFGGRMTINFLVF